MTYAETVKIFLAKVQEIKNSNPKRREPGDGSDGYCDCIGLVIGAVRRMGLKWTGIHGSNWAARKEFVKLERVNSESDLELGDVVLKGRSKGNISWKLPLRYRNGGKYYNGDTTDYYHAGVVTCIDPLRITHMSSKMTVDTKVGQWGYHGKLRLLVNASNDIDTTIDPTIPASNKLAVVVAESGSTVNFRKKPSTASVRIAKIPLGTTVEILQPGETWAAIKYQGKTGYMMAKFLDIIGDGKGQY